jgi:hypothetical protein
LSSLEVQLVKLRPTLYNLYFQTKKAQTMADLAPDENELYDRQIRLWGVEAQVRTFDHHREMSLASWGACDR